MTDVLMGVAAVIVWQATGFAVLWLLRPDLAEETRAALINVWLWPAGLAVQLTYLLVVKPRRERARQRRISAKVAAGEYDADWARQSLRWKGKR